MRPKDVRPCVELTASHPVLAPRYGKIIEDLVPAWISLIDRDGFIGIVFEEARDSGFRLIGAGIVVIVSDEFIRTAKTPPFFWLPPELARRVVHGPSPVLSNSLVRRANASGGVNMVVWQTLLRPEDSTRPEVLQAVHWAFVKYHSGYLLKEVVWQADSVSLVQWQGLQRAGMSYLNPENGRYGEFPPEEHAGRILSAPHICGTTLELQLRLVGRPLWGVFVRHSPRFGFSRGAQRLLVSALGGRTSEEIADELGVSLSGVKKTWNEVYRRVELTSPELLGAQDEEPPDRLSRGREKKQRLLAYLHDHPEELRPLDWKLAQKEALAEQLANENSRPYQK